MENFDAVIIGSGQGGTPLAKKLAQAGWKSALIERQFVGGTCVNYGCTPTKTMIASAKAIYNIKKAADLGITVPEYTVNMPQIIERKNSIVEKFRGGSESGLEKTENLTLIFGEASFVSKNEIKIKGGDGKYENITADKIFINAGARPTIPPIQNIETVPYLTSTTIMDVKEMPEHLLIIGGSYIGLEFGQMYKRFGSKVTILEASDTFLSREDDDVADAIKEMLQEEEIDIHLNASAQSVKKTVDGIELTVLINGKETTITCSHLLISAGRTPNTDTLNLHAAGVEINEKGYINTNEKLETSVPHIYALGDIKGGPAFTHISYNDYVVLINNFVHNKNETIAGRMVPYCMFTDPQLGRIGITEKEAKSKNLNYRVTTLPMKKVARAIETGDTRGLMKAVVDGETGQILGAAILGEEGGEIMSVLQMAMVGNIPWQKIKHMIFAHPLYTESLNNLFLQLEKKE